MKTIQTNKYITKRSIETIKEDRLVSLPEQNQEMDEHDISIEKLRIAKQKAEDYEKNK